MLSKEEIETYKEECRNYIKFMDTAGDNAGWARGLMWYIEELEVRVKELGKGQHSLMQSRKKWKDRYYKERAKRKELIEEQQDIDIKAIERLDEWVTRRNGEVTQAEGKILEIGNKVNEIIKAVKQLDNKIKESK